MHFVLHGQKHLEDKKNLFSFQKNVTDQNRWLFKAEHMPRS